MTILGDAPAGRIWGGRAAAILGVLGLSLYGSRLLMEGLALDWAWQLFLGTVLLFLALGMVFWGLLQLAGLSLWPLLLLYSYVFYPHIQASLGLSIGIVVLAMLLVPRLGWLRALPLGTATLVAGLMLYIWTLAPSILPADAAEFQLVPYLLGIAHPPGYPLYTMLGKLFSLLPWRDVAYRMNLFSALWAGLCLVLVANMVGRLLNSKLAGLLAAAALAVVPTFWAQATTANIRSMMAFFAALLIYVLVVSPRPRVPLFSFILGLAITHHGSLVFLLIPAGLYLFIRGKDWLGRSRVIWAGIGFLVSLSVLLYLPIRGAMQPVQAPPNIATPQGFLEHVLARGFGQDMFYFARPDSILERLKIGADILALEFGWPLLGLSLLGAAVLAIRKPKEATLLIGAFLVSFIVAVTYRAPQTVEYLLPSYVLLAVLLGCGVAGITEAVWWPRLKGAVAAGILLLIVGRFMAWVPSFRWLHNDLSTRRYAEALFAEAPEGAVILANWHTVTSLQYLQYVEGARPDVEIRYIAHTVWEDGVQEELGERPLIVTNRWRFSEAFNRYAPLAGAYLVEDGPNYDLPGEITPLGERFAEEIEFLGYRVDWDGPRVEPGRSWRFQLYWRPLRELEGEYSFFFHLLDRDGKTVFQQDTRHDMALLSVGEVRVDDFPLYLPLEALPGQYVLVAGVYVTSGDGGWRRLPTVAGQDSSQLFSLQVGMRRSPSLSPSGFRVRFAENIQLLGADYDSGAFSGKGRLYLHWEYSGSSPASYQLLLRSQGEIVEQYALEFPEPGYLISSHELPEPVEALALEVLKGEEVLPSLGPWQWPRRAGIGLPEVAKDARYLLFGDEMVLIKVYTGLPKAGQKLEVGLEFMALKPLLKDYTVSVQLEGPNGDWKAQHDTSPANGAIPTLKWLAGMRISDRHRIELPDNASGEATVWVTIYDAFQQEKLGERVEVTRITIPE